MSDSADKKNLIIAFLVGMIVTLIVAFFYVGNPKKDLQTDSPSSHLNMPNPEIKKNRSDRC